MVGKMSGIFFIKIYAGLVIGLVLFLGFFGFWCDSPGYFFISFVTLVCGVAILGLIVDHLGY